MHLTGYQGFVYRKSSIRIIVYQNSERDTSCSVRSKQLHMITSCTHALDLPKAQGSNFKGRRIPINKIYVNNY